ncbi:hypothetical protein AAVH_19893 [Aphelenchoides avenae]|nr:hypothetical protein AAVH_19893 [Aphelenchus avenae]
MVPCLLIVVCLAYSALLEGYELPPERPVSLRQFILGAPANGDVLLSGEVLKEAQALAGPLEAVRAATTKLSEDDKHDLRKLLEDRSVSKGKIARKIESHINKLRAAYEVAHAVEVNDAFKAGLALRAAAVTSLREPLQKLGLSDYYAKIEKAFNDDSLTLVEEMDALNKARAEAAESGKLPKEQAEQLRKKNTADHYVEDTYSFLTGELPLSL